MYLPGRQVVSERLHSRPIYYGSLAALWCAIPALIVFFFWLFFESSVITDLVVSTLPEEIQNLPAERLNLIVNDIKNVVVGNITSRKLDPAMKAAADHYLNLNETSHASLSVVVILLGICGIFVAWKTINPKLRARNHVERVVKYLLIYVQQLPFLRPSALCCPCCMKQYAFLRSSP